MAIKNIIFDFGGVLIDWNPMHLYINIFKETSEAEHFLNNVCTPQWNLKQDAGRPFEEATNELIEQFPSYKNEIKLFFSDWIKMIGGEIKENTSLLKTLKKEFSLYGLTNWSAETFPLVYNKYPFFKELDGIVVSGVEKTVKPDEEIYNILLNKFNLKANESIFIDDNQENIKTAKNLGFKTIHLRKNMILEKELKILNILK
jgi:2-haloacid dehalogenase